MDLYASLFDQYVIELGHAHAKAVKWWNDLIEKETVRTGDRFQAEKSLRRRWPMGPTAYPLVIAVFRKYFLKVNDINNEIWDNLESMEDDVSPYEDSLWGTEDDDDENPLEQPRTVLFERLESVDETLARFMDNMVFIPIGADQYNQLI
jgi:hypothetical protein